MNQKILVTYSTCTGTTREISETIMNTLMESGEDVEVMPMKDVKDLAGYGAVIAGSAIQAGKWLPEAMKFIDTYKNELNKKPFASFLVCMTLAMPKGSQYHEHVSGWLSPVRNIVKPVSEGLFAGSLQIKKIPSLADRLKFRISVLMGVWKEGDHRDREAILAWTRETRLLLNKA